MSGGMIKTDTSGLADKVITNEGDIVIGNALGNRSRLGIGSNLQQLQSDGSQLSWQTISAGGGGQYELVGTTNTLDTSTYTYDSYHLAFSSIDLTTVTGLAVYASVPMDINTIGFRINALTADYTTNGCVVYNAGTNDFYGINSGDAFMLGHWRGGNYTQALTMWIQCDPSGTNDYLQFAGTMSGDGSAFDRTGSSWAGGRQNTDTSQAVTSVSVIEDGIDCLAGGRLTVYKVTR